MKILFVQNMNGVSGSELLLQQMLPELIRRKFQPEMLIVFHKNTEKNKEFVKILQESGVVVYEFYGDAALSPRLLLRIKKLLKLGKYDLIHCNLIHADLWFSIQKMLFFPKLRLISVKHGFDERYLTQHGFDPRYLKRNLYARIERFCRKYINRNIAVSEGIRQFYIRGGMAEDQKISTIYNGLDLSLKGDNFEKKVSGKYALILGRLVPFKGHEHIIRAWMTVKKMDPELRLCLVGDGVHRSSLERLVQELGLQDEVIFTGYQSDPHAYIYHSCFMIVPSICEPFGLIVLESWYHSKPVVAFDVPALNELIYNGKNGLLVPAFDQQAMAVKIVELSADQHACCRMGENGKNRLLDYFSLRRMTDEMIDKYREVCTSN